MVQTWLNGDGLYQKFGVTKTTPNVGGEYRTNGQLREIELKIDLTALTEAELVVSDQVFVPRERIFEVEVRTHTAAATGVAIDLGLIRSDRTTEIDYDGLLAAFPTASMNAAGEKTILSDNTTYDGALIGTTLTNPGYITCSRTTSTAFTAGLIYVTIRWYAP